MADPAEFTQRMLCGRCGASAEVSTRQQAALCQHCREVLNGPWAPDPLAVQLRVAGELERIATGINAYHIQRRSAQRESQATMARFLEELLRLGRELRGGLS